MIELDGLIDVLNGLLVLHSGSWMEENKEFTVPQLPRGPVTASIIRAFMRGTSG